MAGTLTRPIQAASAVSTPTVNKAVDFIETDADPLGVPACKRSDGSVFVPLRSTAPKLRLFVDPMADYGAKFDHRVVFDGATTGGTGVITSAALAAFTAADVGKRIVLSGAGAAGAQYVGTISSINSALSVNVSPNTTTTVSAKGLQIHTDDLTAWTNLINDVNASPYPGAVIKMETPNAPTPFGVSTFTGRSGVSGFLPTITKQVTIDGFGGSHNADAGDYTKVGGSCIAYVGTSVAPTAFGALMTIAPVVSATGAAIKHPRLSHFWLDCRNGDQNEALIGLSLQSCHGFIVEDFFIMDAAAIGVQMQVIAPGNASALGEAKDCTRGSIRDLCIRELDLPAGAVTTPFLMTSAVTLTTTPQSLTVAANALPAAGYLWTATNLGYPVLVNYTGGGGTTTLTGCTVSAQDAINAPATVNGGNIVQAVPGNACCLLMDGDLTANANLSVLANAAFIHGSTWGPAAVEFRNSDSMEFINVVINGGNATNDGAINRVRKPGVRHNGSNTNASLASRNNCFKSGSAGVGGVSIMGVLNTGTRLLAMAIPNHWDEYQLGNAEALPTVEGNAFFYWTTNGALNIAHVGNALIADQAIAAATLTLLTGSLVSVPPQGFQIGTILKWTIVGNSAAVGTAANTVVVRLGTTGTSADAAVATFTTGVGSAAAAEFKIVIELTVRTLGAAATAIAEAMVDSGALGVPGGFIAQANNVLLGVMAAFNTTTAQQFWSVSMLTGAAKTLTIRQCFCECINPANP